MSIQTLFVTWVMALATLSCCAGDVSTPTQQPAWVSFAKAPMDSKAEQLIHARATENVKPNVLQILSAFVYRSSDHRLRLVSYSDADLRFRTDYFLVARIDGKELTVATGSKYPEASKRSLAKRFAGMGFNVDLVTPQELLNRNGSPDPMEPEFIVPYRIGATD